MHATVAKMIVVIARLVVIVAVVVTRAVDFMVVLVLVLVPVNRRGAGRFRNALETGKQDSAEDSNANGSCHQLRYSGNSPDISRTY